MAKVKSKIKYQKSKIEDKIHKETQENYIKFLGTAGARFVMIRQLRSSAGIWVSNILTHRYLDHSGDINVMIEAMTEGGFLGAASGGRTFESFRCRKVNG